MNWVAFWYFLYHLRIRIVLELPSNLLLIPLLFNFKISLLLSFFPFFLHLWIYAFNKFALYNSLYCGLVCFLEVIWVIGSIHHLEQNITGLSALLGAPQAKFCRYFFFSWIVQITPEGLFWSLSGEHKPGSQYNERWIFSDITVSLNFLQLDFFRSVDILYTVFKLWLMSNS